MQINPYKHIVNTKFNMKIILAGLISDKNLGDPIILECVRFLFNKTLNKKDNKIEFAELDFVSLKSTNPYISFFLKILNKIEEIVYRESYIIQNINSYFLGKTYSKRIYDSTAIIVVGGGVIKHNYQLCHLYLSALTKAANKYNIPIYMNAVGVENFNSNSARCILLANALKSEVVKFISTRDNIEIIRNYYINKTKRIETYLVADPAVYAAECFNIYKDSSSETIGIGIIRGTIFKDNKINISEKEIEIFYVELVYLGLMKGFSMQLFTNGLPDDIVFCKKIEITLENKYGIIIESRHPRISKDLVSIISTYKCIIAARLHASIIAYSLNVPSIALVWNDKLINWGKSIGNEEYCIVVNDFSPEIVISKAIKATDNGYNLDKRNLIRESALFSVSKISELIMRLNNKSN